MKLPNILIKALEADGCHLGHPLDHGYPDRSPTGYGFWRCRDCANISMAKYRKTLTSEQRQILRRKIHDCAKAKRARAKTDKIKTWGSACWVCHLAGTGFKTVIVDWETYPRVVAPALVCDTCYAKKFGEHEYTQVGKAWEKYKDQISTWKP